MKIFMLFLITFLGAYSMASDKPLSPGDHALGFKSSYDGTLQPYRLFLPQGIEPLESLPLLVVLHGKWVDQNAWFDYTPVKEYAQRHNYVVIAPHARGDYFYRGAGEQDVLDLIHIAMDRYNIDPDRVYLMGHSMGGWGTWWIGLRNPDLFAAICPMSGYAPPDLLPNARHLRPFMIHSSDDPVVPVKGSREPASLLANLGISFRYKEEDGYGHASRMIGDNFPELFDWMKKHERIDRPRRISFVTRTPARGRAWWVRILETIRYPLPASVEANFPEKGLLRIKTGNVMKFALDIGSMPPFEKGLRISLDGDSFELDQNCGFLVFEYRVREAKWIKQYQSTLSLHRPEKTVLATLAPGSPEITSPTLLTSAACRLLRAETGADLCLFLHDSFQFPGGDINREAILDLYVFPTERLGRFEYRGEPIPEIIGVKPGFFPIGTYDPKANRVYRVVAPLNIAEKFDLPVEPLSDTIAEYLLRALEERRSFP